MSLTEKVQSLGKLLEKEQVNVAELVDATAQIIGCSLFVSNTQGDIIEYATSTGARSSRQSKQSVLTYKGEFKQRLSFLFETAINLPVENGIFTDENYIKAHSYMSIFPIRGFQKAFGHLAAFKLDQPFTEEELILLQNSALIFSIAFYDMELAGSASEGNQQSNIQLVLDSLSFSELKAIYNVFNDLNGMEGFLVASKIADRIGISRSVIVNAMRKLESAGVVDSRSLGIKGTYIKIKNPGFVEMLNSRMEE